MKTPTVRIKIRVKLPNGFRYVDPVESSPGKLKPLYARIGDTEERHPEGVYHLRYQKPSAANATYEAVGNDAKLAVLARQRKERSLAAEAVGVVIVEDVETGAGTPLSESIVEYLKHVRTMKRHKTYLAYALALKQFQEALPNRLTMEAVRRVDMLTFIQSLRDLGLTEQSVANRVRDVKVFWLHQKIKWPMLSTDKLRLTQKKVNAYSKADIKSLLNGATQDESDLFRFLLCTGCREKEAQFAIWPQLDFDHKLYLVRERREYQFKPKDYEERDIPVPDDLLRVMAERHTRHPAGRLIFTNSQDTPNGHLLRVLKEAALRIGLNCGMCVNKIGEPCSTHPVCRKWELHRFRRTFATMLHKNGHRIQDIQRWLGHSKIETTMRYLAGSSDTDKGTRDQINSAFSFV